MAPRRLIIAGAGGLGREVLTYLQEHDAAPDYAFLDDNAVAVSAFTPPCAGLTPIGACAPPLPPVIGTADTYTPIAGDAVLIAIGSPLHRQRIATRLKERGATLAAPFVHRLAWVAGNAQLAPGVIVAPFAIVGAYSVVDAGVMVNIHASIGHDSTIGALSALAPYAVINGFCRIGSGVLIGSGAVVTAGRTIGDTAQIAAGTVVTQDVPATMMAAGNPTSLTPSFKT